VQLRNNNFFTKIIFCRFFVRKTNIGEFGTQKTCNKIIFTKWNFIFHKNYFLQKNIFIKINFVWKNFFRSCILQKIYFLKSYLKKCKFFEFFTLSSCLLKLTKTQKIGQKPKSLIFCENGQFWAKNEDFSDLAQSPKMPKTPILVKNGQKWGFKFQEGMGQSGRLRPGCVDSLICEA